MPSQSLELDPSIEIIGIEFNRAPIVRERLGETKLLLPQVAEEVVDLRLCRSLLDQLRKNLLRNRLGLFTRKGLLASKAVALHAPELVRHELVRAAVMLLGLGVAA